MLIGLGSSDSLRFGGIFVEERDICIMSTLKIVWRLEMYHWHGGTLPHVPQRRLEGIPHFQDS